MAMQLKLLINTVATLTKALANKESNGGGNVGSSSSSISSTDGSREKKPWKKSQCMGGNCWSHGYHPCDDNHTTTKCTFKKDGHNSNATFDNTMGGNDYWPPVHCIIDSQKMHSTFVGKSKPTT